MHGFIGALSEEMSMLNTLCSRPQDWGFIIRSSTYSSTTLRVSRAICNQRKQRVVSTDSWSAQRKSNRIGKFVKCNSVGRNSESRISDAKAVYRGVYGPWSIESSDVQEVILYRTGLVTAAASFIMAASAVFIPGESSLAETIKQNIDFFYMLGAGGLGLSLLLIHIYVSEIKLTLQALWALGVVGSLATYMNLARPAGESMVQYVADNPSAVWFVGPVFAALTGLVFKEGLCYGKLEAVALTFVIPTILLGHLTGIFDDGVKLSILAVWMALFVIFAGRKFTQPIKDDIGDKSVFMFNALSEEEKKALLTKLEQQKFQSEP